eukprot:1223933-Rhodomonas_salina.2
MSTALPRLRTICTAQFQLRAWYCACVRGAESVVRLYESLSAWYCAFVRGTERVVLCVCTGQGADPGAHNH